MIRNRKQTEHRIRGAARYARPGTIWLAALLMNAPVVGGAALLGWFAFSADEPALQAMAGVFFAMGALWAVLVTMESVRVLRRWVRRGGDGGGGGGWGE